MDKKYVGFAAVTVLVFVACHNIFNKDKAGPLSTTPVSLKKPVEVTAPAVPLPVKADSNLRYVYLTFDDGPDAGTLNTYEICRTKGAKATFFLVGEHANLRSGKGILDSMRKDMRHFLFANHSYTHAAHNRYETFYKKSDKALADFLRVHDSLRFQAPIARFPGNNAWMVEGTTRATRLTRPLTKLMDSIGYSVLGWDVEWNFDKNSRPVQSAELMAQQVVNAFETKTSLVKNHVVLLAHDRMFREEGYRDSLAKMITILQSQKGYIFETADQYPKLKKADRTLIASRK